MIVYDKEQKKIDVLMSFYKKAYQVIGIVILVCGIILIPFLNFILDMYS